MNDVNIRRIDEDDDRVGSFINEEFTRFGEESGVELNYDEFCFVAEDDAGNIIGVITGRAYYNEVHIGDLIIGKSYRKSGLGSKLVGVVEELYKNKGYDKITLTTFGFQAPEFYKKLGYQIEFVREDKDPKLCKYFLSKNLAYYAYKMCFDKEELQEPDIVCIPFDTAFATAYRAAYNAAFHPMRKALDIEPYNWFADDNAVMAKAADTYMFISDGELIGAVSCHENEIDDLFVSTSKQGNGYGRELLLWAIKHIREKNNDAITLHVAEWNQGALKLYKNAGFTIRSVEKIK